MTSTYWFVSAPADPTKPDTVNKVKDKVSSKGNEYAEVYSIGLPDFKVGTLDALYVLSDDLQKLDPAVEAMAVKIAENLKTLLHNDIDQWRTNLTVNDKNIDQYLKTFQWNTMRYRADKSLRELTDLITQEVNSIDTLMKNKMQTYNQVKSQLTTLQRKQNGNLAVRNLNDILKKEYFVTDSEYLTTLIVAVPKTLQKDWLNSYETLTQMVVPRSTQKIAEDDEYILYTVTLFQRVVDEFTLRCRENKFLVRDYKWDEKAMAEEKKQMAEIGASERELGNTLLRLSKTNFGEIFAAWIHIKALRVYTESILRYGLPPDFAAMLLKIKPKQERKVKDVLTSHFARLAGAGVFQSGKSSNGPVDEQLEENLQTLLGGKDYTPFVLFPIAVPSN
ncbi:hypothetical protein HK102_013267 [Quaeritorhiza haematococci]|nr:hypothetical protein HK102_013267 [Quaeritorhiza haematococci]